MHRKCHLCYSLCYTREYLLIIVLLIMSCSYVCICHMFRDVFINIFLFSFNVIRKSLTCLFSDISKYKLIERKKNSNRINAEVWNRPKEHTNIGVYIMLDLLLWWSGKLYSWSADWFAMHIIIAAHFYTHYFARFEI